MTEITLPTLTVSSSKSSFKLRCIATAWSDDFGAELGYATRPGLILINAVGADTAAKAIRSTLYQPDIEAEFVLETEDSTERLARARCDDKPVGYAAWCAKLAPGAVHLIAIAKIPGLLSNISDDHLWAELSGERYTTPLLRPWVGWLKRKMIENGGIIMAEGSANVGVLQTKQIELDDLVSEGVRSGHLRMVV